MTITTIPQVLTIYHQKLINGGTDGHGNPVQTLAAPVARKVQSISQFGYRGSSHEIVSPDFLARVETTIEIAVSDPSIYSERDQVIVGATGADSQGNPIGGTAFHVEGAPMDDRLGPLPLLNRMLGGSIHVRRIT